MALTLFRYEIEDEPFDEGGMGELYKAKDRLSGQDVVIKTVNPRRLRLDEKTIESFFKEAEASFHLSQKSPNIVKTLDIGLEGGTYYMALEYMSGGNIIPKLGNVSPEVADFIISQVLEALKMAHKNKIVHSDISPDNILCNAEGTVYKVSDFGLLKILETYMITKGQSIHTGGKPHYMPPAHYFDPDAIGPETDLYGLGIVYFQLISGKLLKPRFPEPPDVRTAFMGFFASNVMIHEGRLEFIHSCLYGNYNDALEASDSFKHYMPLKKAKDSRRSVQ